MQVYRVSDHQLYGVVHIALLLRRIADELPALVVDQYRQHLFAPRAVYVVSYVGFQSLPGDLVAPLKEELRVLATDEWNGELSLARIVEDKHQVFSGTFGSFAFDADMTRVVGALIFHVLNGVFARRCGQAVVFVLFGGRSQRNERVSGVGCIEHLNNSEKIGWIWGRSRGLR